MSRDGRQKISMIVRGIPATNFVADSESKRILDAVIENLRALARHVEETEDKDTHIKLKQGPNIVIKDVSKDTFEISTSFNDPSSQIATIASQLGSGGGLPSPEEEYHVLTARYSDDPVPVLEWVSEWVRAHA